MVKLMFHLPGRKSKKDSCSGAADHSNLFYEIPKPSLNSGSKANRLLGLPDLGCRQSTHAEEQCVGSTYAERGTASIIVSSLSVPPIRKSDENGHYSSEKQERKLLEQSAQALQAQPSSSSYREPFVDASSNWDSLTDATSIDSPVASSITPDGHQSTLPSRRSWFGLKAKKQNQFRSGAFESTRLGSYATHQLQLSSIIPARRPKDKVQHWFDALEEEDSLMPTRQIDYSEHRYSQAPNPSNVARSTPAADLCDFDKEGCNPMDHNRHLSTYARISSFQHGMIPTQLEPLPPRYGLHPSEFRRTQSSSTEQDLDSRQSRESIFMNINLQKQSVLALSVTEDDSENEVAPTADASRRRIRRSIDDFASGSVSLHSAQQVAFSRSGPIATKKARMISRPIPCPDQALVEDTSSLRVQNQLLEKSDFLVSEHNEGFSLERSRPGLEYEANPANTHSLLPRPYGLILQCRDADELQVTGEAGRMIAAIEDKVQLLDAMQLEGGSKRPKALENYSIFPSRMSGNGLILGRNAEDPDPRTSVAQTGMSNFPSPPLLAFAKI
ncbi:MAG: hypothetical protein LQ347_000179 [Umbilicaria vellea]|nr:MAG: hypothetical protein LQ347_000179 [Umbilicaria vellea]